MQQNTCQFRKQYVMAFLICTIYRCELVLPDYLHISSKPVCLKIHFMRILEHTSTKTKVKHCMLEGKQRTLHYYLTNAQVECVCLLNYHR